MKKVLITAGPTHEPIDPVRFIGNHSSGKMGFALADAFAEKGYGVTVVAGPTSVSAQHPGVKVERVTTAAEMFDATAALIEEADVAVFAAAVADFTPSETAGEKIKRGKDEMVIRLQPTKDIAGTLGKKKRSNQVFVGFALETGEGIEAARGKLVKKNLDLIVLNSLQDEGAGFGTDTNKILMIDKSGNIDTFELKHKREVAADIVERTIKMLKNA